MKTSEAKITFGKMTETDDGGHMLIFVDGVYVGEIQRIERWSRHEVPRMNWSYNASLCGSVASRGLQLDIEMTGFGSLVTACLCTSEAIRQAIREV